MLLPAGESRGKSAVRLLVAVAMCAIGVLHFLRPAGFVKIVPPFLPALGNFVVTTADFGAGSYTWRQGR